MKYELDLFKGEENMLGFFLSRFDMNLKFNIEIYFKVLVNFC